MLAKWRAGHPRRWQLRLVRLVRRVLLSVVCLYVGLGSVQRFRDAQPDAAWRDIRALGVLRVAMDTSFPPFADVIDGQPAGIDVDIAQEIGRRLGVRVQLVTVGYDGLYDALIEGRADITISALAFDPYRYGAFLYTRPYFDAGQVLVSLRGGYRAMPDLEGRRLAVEYGSLGDEAARLWRRRLRMLEVQHGVTANAAMEMLLTGQADAALVDAVSARLFRRRHPQVVLAGQTVVPDTYAVVTRGRSFDLAGVINAALEAMNADGTLERILARWL
jgi:polar amino acid transport system substrate-binding protein